MGNLLMSSWKTAVTKTFFCVYSAIDLSQNARVQIHKKYLTNIEWSTDNNNLPTKNVFKFFLIIYERLYMNYISICSDWFWNIDQ